MLHSHGEPSAEEQEGLELLQRARQDPAAEGVRLANDPSAQSAIAFFKVDTQALIADFATYAPTPPLAFEQRLLDSSRRHALDMSTQGFQDHTGSDGTGPGDRIKQAGYAFSAAAENIYAHADSPTHAHASFLIDWGVESLGHRIIALELEQQGYRDIGITVLPAQHADVGPWVVVHNFGRLQPPLRPFLVGVVYDDLDGDGAYDAGEGLAGQGVVPERGETYAVTSQSGGYAIPLDLDAGALRVQWVAPDGSVLDQKEVQVGTQNVKLDFTQSVAP